MIPEVARYILKHAAGYSIFAPLLPAGCLASKMLNLPDDTSELSRYGHAAAIAVLLALCGYNWFKFARPLYKGHRPELLRKAVNSASTLMWIFPLMITQPLISVVMWIPLWGAVCTLLDISIQNIQPQIIAALAKDSPEATLASDAAA